MTILASILAQLLHIALMLAMAPLLAGFLLWLPARIVGRSGPSPVMPFRDLLRLDGKQVLHTTTASAVGRLAPLLSFAAAATAATLVPSFTLGMTLAPLADLLTVAMLLISVRVVLALAALDGGTAPAGLAARQLMARTLLSEPALALVILTMALLAGGANLDWIIGLQHEGLLRPASSLALVGAALVAVAFIETDDVAGLDTGFSGRDLALVGMARMLHRLAWLDLLGALMVPIGMASADGGIVAWLLGLLCWTLRLFALAVGLGVMQVFFSGMQRGRLPDVLALATLLALVAVVLVLANLGSA